jgi:hypothetical protein
MFMFDRCAYNDIIVEFDCSESTLAIALESKTDVSNCRAIDGGISVSASGGAEPYTFNINGGEYQTNNRFTDLGPGTYTLKVKDANGCWKTMDVDVAAAGSTLSASALSAEDNQCATDNGTITISASGGKAPYQFQLDSQGYGSSNGFTNLKHGQHVVIVKDDEGCQITLSVQVVRGKTGISYAGQIKDILTTNCNTTGCHGTGTGSRDWTNFDNVKSKAANIKIRTANRTMPPTIPLNQAQIDLIGCWVDDGAFEN